MPDFALFCTSHRGDLERIQRLIMSVAMHNEDDLPFYLSVPRTDLGLFYENVPPWVKLLVDEDIDDPGDRYESGRFEEIADYYGEGWVQQQFVKTRFYRTDLAPFYLCLDSDLYFIRDFSLEDFMVFDDVPYTVFHERKTAFEWSDKFSSRELWMDPRDGWTEHHEIIQRYLKRPGRPFAYGPAPFVWDASVWQEADEEFGLEALFKVVPTELKWYGELYLHFDRPLVPIQPLFKVFHYAPEYEFYIRNGWREADFKTNYLGLGMQSTWADEGYFPA